MTPPNDHVFEIGEIVTRDGSDRHRVIRSGRDPSGTITVVCISAPISGWCKVGDEESNSARRYSRATDS